MRIMGLDVGSKTVGVAVSDPFGWTAQGIEIIKIDEDKEQFGLNRLVELIGQYEVEKIVIGLPKNMNNSEGFRVEASRRYANEITKLVDLPIDFQDERLTTVQAERMLVSEGNVSRKKRKKVIDKLAAVILLQNYLDQHSKGAL
ncbi:MAG: Holliday junction resolvase RuvX [Bavariicoccus seileri]|uniref:Putative pre-16S rRNA nuclease n=1 Tax=Bavariicoccus seileri TaxID=549685 RepID=A0A3D4S4J4_9ENTE|nr:Holliday junction resolvase RuvX [Bavariicoccus seileri]HCS93749.1 Holliday junction resolvase RuvX [Bavariicoccus seileri]